MLLLTFFTERGKAWEYNFTPTCYFNDNSRTNNLSGYSLCKHFVQL